jgi:type IV secretory pathway TraG/TraD family ATPase VirD4
LNLVIRCHVLLVGGPGSGKTTVIRRMMADVLPEVGKGHDHRALCLDYKNELFPYLCGISNGPVYTFTAADLRCVGWDIAKDVTSVSSCNQAATHLIPDDNSNNRFFIDAPRHYVACLLQALNRVLPGQWTLRDVMLALNEPEAVKHLVSRFAETRAALQYFVEGQTFSNIQSSIQAKVFPYSTIAACYHRATRLVSLNEWIRSECILHFGVTEAARFEQETINRLMFQRASEIALSQSESFTRLTTFWVDEARALRKQNSLPHLACAGRSKGISMILGFQDFDGMCDVYGEHVAEELGGLCSAKVILPITSPKTADWASRSIASAECKDFTRSGVHERTLQGGSISEHRVERPLITPSEFLAFPATSVANGITAVYSNARFGTFKTTLTWKEVFDRIPPSPAHIPYFVPRPNEHQLLTPWSEAERTRLGLPKSSDGSGPGSPSIVRRR